MADEQALTQMYESDDKGADTPRVSVWYPRSPPHGRLQTHSPGWHEPDVLPAGLTIAHVTVGGIDFGGPLDDLELLFKATSEVIAILREQESTMRSESARG